MLTFTRWCLKIQRKWPTRRRDSGSWWTRVMLSRLSQNCLVWRKIWVFHSAHEKSNKSSFKGLLCYSLSVNLNCRVLAANDADADEEAMPSEFQSNLSGNKKSNVVRRAGGFGQMSGADSRHYTETAAAKKKKRESQARLYFIIFSRLWAQVFIAPQKSTRFSVRLDNNAKRPRSTLYCFIVNYYLPHCFQWKSFWLLFDKYTDNNKKRISLLATLFIFQHEIIRYGSHASSWTRDRARRLLGHNRMRQW